MSLVEVDIVSATEDVPYNQILPPELTGDLHITVSWGQFRLTPQPDITAFQVCKITMLLLAALAGTRDGFWRCDSLFRSVYDETQAHWTQVG